MTPLLDFVSQVEERAEGEKRVATVVVTPRFEDKDGMSFFAGYDQVAGTAYLDTDGHLYGLVRVEDFNRVRNDRDTLCKIIRELAKGLDRIECHVACPCSRSQKCGIHIDSSEALERASALAKEGGK